MPLQTRGYCAPNLFPGESHPNFRLIFMPSEPDNRKIEELLKAYGKKRQDDLGAPLELHPATRKMLQAEAAKLRPASTEKSASFLAVLWRLWPKLAIGAGAAVLLSLAIVNVNRNPNAGEKNVASAKRESEKRPDAKPGIDFERLDRDGDAPRPTASASAPAAPAQPMRPDALGRERDELAANRDGSQTALGLQSESEVLQQRSKDSKTRMASRSAAGAAQAAADNYKLTEGLAKA